MMAYNNSPVIYSPIDDCDNATIKTIGLDSKNQKLWQSFLNKKQEQRLFPTEGAVMLGVSEFELLLACPDSVYLGDNCRQLLLSLHRLGEVLSIVRNKFAVHEKIGVFSHLSLGETMGLALGEEGLDLRLFLTQFKHALAIGNLDKQSYNIAFFDGQGRAIFKVFLLDSDTQSVANWQALVDDCRANKDSDVGNNVKCQSVMINPTASQTLWQRLPMSDNADFQREWLAMTDIHQFYSLLKRHNLDRPNSYCEAPKEWAWQVSSETIEAIFCASRDEQLPVMIFVGNTAMIQIQTGVVHHIKRMGDWLNILDKNKSGFTLHLNDKALAQVWCVKRPNGNNGDYTLSFEGFDDRGNSIITIFGQRDDNNQQCLKWQALANKLRRQFGVN